MGDHRGYAIGPALAADEQPFPAGWEQNADDCLCLDWELVLLAADGLHRTRVEEVVRCSACHAPRCGHSTDEDPCVLRRHHSGPHFLESDHPKPPPFEEDPVAIRFGFTRWQRAQAARLSGEDNPQL